MVDEGRVTRLLRGIDDRTTKLERAAPGEPADDEALWLEGVMYLLITTIEGCVDVAHHIASAEGWPSPGSNADALRLLGERRVVDAELAGELARAVGFRNVLVHQYAEVDPDVVRTALRRLGVFRSFTSQVAAWLLDH